MRTFPLTYLTDPSDLRAEFLVEHAIEADRRGHTVRWFSTGRCPSLPPSVEASTVDPDALAFDDGFVVATSTTVSAAVRAGGAIPLHFVSRPPSDGAERPDLHAALSLPTFKIANSRRIQRALQERYRSRCWFVPDGVSVPSGLGRRPRRRSGPWRLLLVGSRADVALDAASRLRDLGHPIELSWLGSSVEPWSESASVDRHLGSAGPDVRRAVFRNSDVLVSLDASDDDDYLAIEAMAHGVCAVLSDTPAHHRLGPGSAYAEFVDPEDIAALTDTLSGLFSDPARRARISDAGVAASRRMGWDEHFDRLESVLAEISHTYGDAYVLDHADDPHAPIRSLDSLLLAHQVEFAGSLVVNRDVAVVGGGSNGVATRLAAIGAASVASYSTSDVSLAYARRHHAHPSVRYTRWSADETIGPVDVVIALDAPHVGVSARDVVHRAAQDLSPGGALLVSAPHRATDVDPSLDLSAERWTDELVQRLRERFQRVIVLGQSTVDGHLVIGPEVDRPDGLATLVMATHPTMASPPTENDLEWAFDDVEESEDDPPHRNESRRNRRAA